MCEPPHLSAKPNKRQVSILSSRQHAVRITTAPACKNVRVMLIPGRVAELTLFGMSTALLIALLRHSSVLSNGAAAIRVGECRFFLSWLRPHGAQLVATTTSGHIALTFASAEISGSSLIAATKGSLATNRREHSALSSSSAATCPNERSLPARGLTPRTTRL
jgi:hypothetical protein